jgi:hypothetical protein
MWSVQDQIGWHSLDIPLSFCPTTLSAKVDKHTLFSRNEDKAFIELYCRVCFFKKSHNKVGPESMAKITNVISVYDLSSFLIKHTSFLSSEISNYFHQFFRFLLGLFDLCFMWYGSIAFVIVNFVYLCSFFFYRVLPQILKCWDYRPELPYRENMSLFFLQC